MTTASKITMFRIALIPLFMAAMMITTPYSNVVALGIFILAGVTDHIDGYVARHYNQVTTFGKFIDPLADKILVLAAIVILVQWNRMPAWAAVVVLAREFAVTGLRLVAAGDGIVIAAGISGKVKTVVSLVCLSFMLANELHDFELIPGLLNVDQLALALIVITTVYSGASYFIRNRKILVEMISK
ncbi:MAG: CDP-diacylglycerol--glycerol-3-phosphate 3-phosphatidyltransferase [Oscillospiraceae bacterium]|jgi:CDP-diacylglycerol--glycerol-3-phosphate 3-phosphatidyltransferase|nr:CDP-diacylglycerol--glycerol-3-phosphate 3-phosphatidyltransferase [Oscillospiraceae bacterium]